MAGAFTAVDLSQLAAPDVVESVDFETILQAMLDDLRARDSEFDALVESDPAFKILEVAAFRETLLRQRVNEAAKAVMLAYAAGSDLDNLGALFSVERQIIDEGDPSAIPPVPPTFESDKELRRRIQLSVEGFSVAGPEGAYVFHALSASSDVKDAAATSPNPGDVLVTVLSREGDGTADQTIIGAVDETLSADEIRPLTDNVTVQSANVITYTVDATLYFYSGPDRNVVLQAATDAINEYVEEQHRIGLDVTLSGVYAALHQPGVQRVELTNPSADIEVNRQSAAFCTSISLTDGGVDE